MRRLALKRTRSSYRSLISYYSSTTKRSSDDHNKKDKKTEEEPDNTPENSSSPTPKPFPLFVDNTLRGMSQVVFANNPRSGLVLTAGTALVAPWMGSLGLIGLVSSTATAKILALDETTTSQGLHGYNGVLVGFALGAFLDVDFTSASEMRTCVAGLAVAGGASSTLLYHGLTKALGPSVPVWTIPFNVTTLATIAIAKPYLDQAQQAMSESAQTVHGAATGVAEFVGEATSSVVQATAAGAESSSEPISAMAARAAHIVEATELINGPLGLIIAPLTGVSQIFMVNSTLVGVCVLGALSIDHDPETDFVGGGFSFAAFGSYVGMGTALVLGGQVVELSAITAGMVGFNPALTALAVHTYLKPSMGGIVLAGGGAVVTTLLTVGMVPLFGAHLGGLPVCTLPFCIVAAGIVPVAKILNLEMKERSLH